MSTVRRLSSQARRQGPLSTMDLDGGVSRLVPGVVAMAASLGHLLFLSFAGLPLLLGFARARGLVVFKLGASCRFFSVCCMYGM